MYPTLTVGRFTKISGKHNVTRKAQRALIRVCIRVVIQVNPKKMRCKDKEIEIALDGQPKRPTTMCMRSPKRKRLIKVIRCFATATDINGCSVARSIEVTIGKVSYQVQSTDVCLCYQRLRVLTTISRQLGQGSLQSRGSPLFMINHRSSYECSTLFCCIPQVLCTDVQ